MLGLLSELRATTVLSILDSMHQRGLSVEAAAEIADVDVDVMRGLVQRRDYRNLGLDSLAEILDAIDASGPRYGGRA